MSKHGFFQNRAWLKILGILALGMIVFLVGWTVSGVLAQGGGGSEPGANTAQTDETSTGRLPPSSPPEAGVYTPSEAGIDSVWPNLWYTVMGAVFVPSDSDITYSYGSAGCIHPTSIGYWRASVNLPDGAVIKYIYINYYNSDPGSSSFSTAYLTRFKNDGTVEDLAGVSSRPGTVTGIGYFFDLSTEVTFTVNNLSYGYAFTWTGGITQKLCSIQVGYYPPPLYITNLPFITK
jgi:hypothetical protein